jgi:hypothetical protein
MQDVDQGIRTAADRAHCWFTMLLRYNIPGDKDASEDKADMAWTAWGLTHHELRAEVIHAVAPDITASLAAELSDDAATDHELWPALAPRVMRAMRDMLPELLDPAYRFTALRATEEDVDRLTIPFMPIDPRWLGRRAFGGPWAFAITARRVTGFRGEVRWCVAGVRRECGLPEPWHMPPTLAT